MESSNHEESEKNSFTKILKKPNNLNSTTLMFVILFASLMYAIMMVWVGGDDFITSISSISYRTLLLVFVLVNIGYGFRFYRWHLYLQKLGYDIPVSANARIFAASFLMAISPGKVGEAIRSYFLKKEFQTPATPTLTAYFCERFTDVLSMIILSSIGILVFPKGNLLLVGILMLQVIFLLLLQKQTVIQNWLFDPLEKIDWISPWVEKLEEFYVRSGELLSFKFLSIATLLGVIAWGLEGYCLALIMRDLGGSAFSSTRGIFIFASSVLLGTAAMLPGGLGSSEAIMVSMILFFGYSKVTAVTSTVIVRGLTLWYAVFIGLIAWIFCLRILHQLELDS